MRKLKFRPFFIVDKGYLGELDDESDLERRGSGREIANIELTFSEAVFASLMELYLNESGLI